MCSAAWLSQYNRTGLSCCTCKSFNRYNSHVTSHVVVAMDLYSALAEDLETMDCFFDLNDINESPRNTQYPVRDFLVSGQPAQSASQYAFSCKSESQEKKYHLTWSSFYIL